MDLFPEDARAEVHMQAQVPKVARQKGRSREKCLRARCREARAPPMRREIQREVAQQPKDSSRPPLVTWQSWPRASRSLFCRLVELPSNQC